MRMLACSEQNEEFVDLIWTAGAGASPERVVDSELPPASEICVEITWLSIEGVSAVVPLMSLISQIDLDCLLLFAS